MSTEYQNVTITQRDWEKNTDEMDLNTMAVNKLIFCKYLECHVSTCVVKQVVDVPVIKQVTVPTVQTVERVVEAGLRALSIGLEALAPATIERQDRKDGIQSS